jgi:hypothetical protein
MPEHDAQQPQRQDADHQDLYFSVEDVAAKLKVSARWLADQCRDGLASVFH